MKSDEELLAEIERRAKVISDHVRMVATGKKHAFFLHGPGGHGKTYAVKKCLDAELAGSYQHHNSKVTARALFDSLANYPDSVHVFEDCEELYKDKTAAGLLRSACQQPRGGRRIVCYETANAKQEVTFEGGCVIVSNEPLTGGGIMGALASRFRPLEWQHSREELAAMMRSEAAKGYSIGRTKITPDECREVADYLIVKMAKAQQVDLRSFFESALPAYAAWKDGETESHWHDLVEAQLRGEVKIETRAERLNRERDIAIDCYVGGENTEERLGFWQSQTGKGKQAFYDRLKEARAEGMV